MRDSILGVKTFSFAIEIIKTYKNLVNNNEFILSKQLVRSGTSIGANVREALEAQSKKDFVAKLSIALKEAVEAEYWIELMCETEYLNSDIAEKLLKDVKEIIRITSSIIKTTKSNMQKNVTKSTGKI